MKIIPLTRGMIAAVDDEDFDWLNQWKWTALLTQDKRWYARKRDVLMHRLIMRAKRGQQIDHWDRNTLNNQKGNLRFSNQSQNVANSSPSSCNTSGFKGVTLYRNGKWQAQLMVNGKNLYLGRFETPAEAALAYDTAALSHFGEFAATNRRLARI
jgi:hypothetical protein